MHGKFSGICCVRWRLHLQGRSRRQPSNCRALHRWRRPNGLAALNTFDIFDVAFYIDYEGRGIPPRFAVPSYVDEMVRAQRYFQSYSAVLCSGYASAASQSIFVDFPFPRMRATPAASFGTVTYNNATGLIASTVLDNHVRLRITSSAAGQASGGVDMTLRSRL